MTRRAVFAFLTALLLVGTVPAVAQTNSFPPPDGVIFTYPIGNTSTAIGAAFMPMGYVPEGSLVSAIAAVNGQPLPLRKWNLGSGVTNGYPWLWYPLTDPTLPVQGLQVGTVVTVAVTPPANLPASYYQYYPPATVQTAPMIRGAEQSMDNRTLTIYGTFVPGAPTTVYPVPGLPPLTASAVTVMADRIVVDLMSTEIRNFEPSLMSFTVAQKIGGVTLCDSVPVLYRTPPFLQGAHGLLGGTEPQTREPLARRR